MWPDNETADDLIGFQVHADLLRACVTNPKMLPLTIGVFGDWGGGKTSIMKMLERDLDSDQWPEGSAERAQCEGTAVVYINTWLFEGYDDAKAALLSSVLLALAEHKRLGPKLRDGARALLKSVNWMRLARLSVKHAIVPATVAAMTGGVGAIPAALALSTGVSRLLPARTEEASGKEANAGDSPPVPDWSGALEDRQGAGAMDVRTFRDRFAGLLADGGIRSLVVLVDDLDRCSPERIVENLEAIKLFLSVDQTAFVIGADRRVVEHAIRSRYAIRATEHRDGEESDRLVKDYVEKLVQIPYSLPRLSATEIQTYMALLFCQHHLDEAKFSLCLNACRANRERNRYGTFGYGDVIKALNEKAVPKALGEALALSAAAAPLIADGLKGNPRQVKRFLNALLLRKELARVAQLNLRDDVLVKLMILEYAHPTRFIELFGLQAAEEGKPKRLAELEQVLVRPDGDRNEEERAKGVDTNWATTPIRRWVAMEPSLTDIDLRDYFWVARDRLESTFTEVAMLPPVVRTVLDGLFSNKKPKQHAACESAAALTEDERATLLNQIDKRITRNPGEKAGYDALRLLTEREIAGAAELLANILLTRPHENMPRTVGLDVINLLQAKPALHEILDPVRQRLLISESAVARAAKSAKPRR